MFRSFLSVKINEVLPKRRKRSQLILFLSKDKIFPIFPSPFYTACVKGTKASDWLMAVTVSGILEHRLNTARLRGS